VGDRDLLPPLIVESTLIYERGERVNKYMPAAEITNCYSAVEATLIHERVKRVKKPTSMDTVSVYVMLIGFVTLFVIHVASILLP